MISIVLEHPVISIIVAYVFMCWLIACACVIEQATWESCTADVPYGDLEYYDKSPFTKFFNQPKHVRIIVYITLFPSMIFIALWMLFCSIVNSILYGV